MTMQPVSLEQALDIAEARAYASKTPSFPPLDDSIAFIKQVDWADVRQRCRGGVNNCGLVIAVFAAKLHDLGCWLAEV